MFSNARTKIAPILSEVPKCRIRSRSKLYAKTPYSVNSQVQRNERYFYLDVNGRRATISYEKEGKCLSLYHAAVPSALQGRGIGKMLTKGTFEYIATNNLKMKLYCHFLQHYLTKYGQKYQTLLCSEKDQKETNPSSAKEDTVEKGSGDELQVQRNSNQFYLIINNHRAFVQYEQKGSHITLYETLVPDALAGRGIGKILSKSREDIFDEELECPPMTIKSISFQAVFEYIAANDLRARVECDFLQHYVQKYGKQYQRYIEN